MAQGDVVFFDSHLLDVVEKQHDHELDAFNLGYIDAVVTPLVTTAIPHWAGAGTTNLFTNQVALTGNYSGPLTLANPSAVLNAGVIDIDFDDPAVLSQNASNDTDFTWGIIYNNTNANKHAVGFVDLGGAFDATTGDLTVTWGTPCATLNQA